MRPFCGEKGFHFRLQLVESHSLMQAPHCDLVALCIWKRLRRLCYMVNCITTLPAWRRQVTVPDSRYTSTEVLSPMTASDRVVLRLLFILSLLSELGQPSLQHHKRRSYLHSLMDSPRPTDANYVME